MSEQMHDTLDVTREVPRRFGFSRPFWEGTRERKVLPGKRIFVAVTSYVAPPADDARCAAGVSFIPQVNAQYEIRYTRDDAATHCAAQVMRLQPLADGGASVAPEPTQQGFRALRAEYLCEAR